MKILKSLPIESLQRGLYQPRDDFDDHLLQELAQSIEAQGLIEPLIVRETTTPHRYEIIAGERRWRAAMMAGLAEVPCLIGQYTDEQTAAVTLIENIQRQDLNLLEEASGYQRLHLEFHFNQDEIATLVGKSSSHIDNILRLLTLCEPIQIQLRSRQLSIGHARALVGLSDEQQKKLAQCVMDDGWSVRRLEEAVRQSKLAPHPTKPPANHLDIAHLEAQLAEQMGAPVQIINDDTPGGWLKIKFFDNDTLSGLLERMGLRYD